MENVDREALVEIDNEYGHDLSWTGYKWNLDKDYEYNDEKIEKAGHFTGRIPIFDKDGEKEVFSIYTVDSETH